MDPIYSVDKIVKIKNVDGTEDRYCSCGTWLDHWENLSGELANQCAVLGCQDGDLVGAHIVRTKAKGKDYR